MIKEILQSVLEYVEMMENHETELGEHEERICQVEDFHGISVEHFKNEGNTWSDAYDAAVWWNLTNGEGYTQFMNPHVGGDGPNIAGFRGTSQVCCPGVRFPAGHFDMVRTMVVHPAVPVRGSGRNTRLWFRGNPADYMTDDARWGSDPDSKQAPNARGGIVPICVPHSVIHHNGQEWMGYECTLEGFNIKYLKELGSVINGIGVFGHHHNLRLRNLHLVTDTHRFQSIGVNLLPSSRYRALPWGARMGLSYLDPQNAEKGFSCHMLDADMDDLFLEFWQTGVCYTGIKCRLRGRSVYTQVGFHYYGQSGWGANSQRIDWIPDSEFRKNDGNAYKPEMCLAGIMTRRGDSSLQVASQLPVWLEENVAPEERGGFQKGARIW